MDGTAVPGVRSPRRRKLFRVVGALLIVSALLAVVGAVYEAIAEARDRADYPPPGQLVDVDGHWMHINCSGAGSPTVIIDAGLGDWSTGWAWVQAEVAATTRVCTFDRAGIGWSEPGPLPRTARQSTQELHTLLGRAGIEPPYLVVGHSMGGLHARVFAADYRSEVSGLVLIEAMNPGAGPVQTGVRTGPRSLFGFDSIPAALARVGLVRLLGGPLGLHPGLPTTVAGSYAARGARPDSAATFLDESRALPESLEQARSVQTLGSLPLLVLSRNSPAAQDAAWQARQSDLLRLSDRSAQSFADRSGHLVAIDQPEAAVAAIVQMVHRVR